MTWLTIGVNLSCFIRARPIDARYRHLIHPQINAELRAMMDHVAYDEAAHHRWPRHAENSLPAAQQRPRLRPVGVAGFLQGGARVFHVLVKSRQHFGAGAEVRRLRFWTARR